MREIKFRAWDTKRKTMRACDGVSAISGKPIVWLLVDEGSGTYTDENCIPLQYTGLTDKNGKEIYEGDIVRCTLEIGPYARIMGTVEWSKPSAAFRVVEPPSKKGVSSSWDMWLDMDEGWKIIGNIYENPELK